MKQARANASCAVFEGRLVVTGGFFGDDLDTVEMNDHTAHVTEHGGSKKRSRSATVPDNKHVVRSRVRLLRKLI